MQISNATSQTTLLATETKTGGLSTKSAQLSYQKTNTYVNGTANNQANESWDDSRTLASSANETLDLSGSLTDAFGNSVVFTAIKELIIENTSLTGSMTVGNTGANGWVGPLGSTTGVQNIAAGGRYHMSAPLAGWPVTAATADLLKITNNDGSNPLTYNISILGTA